jgi:predicted dehydrogenase
MNTPQVGIGIVGYGLMGKAHSYGYTLAPRVRDLPCRPSLRVISGRNGERVERAAVSYGVARAVTDWREVVNAPDVDIVDICTPTGTHPEIVEAAASAGKAIVCEKPLGADYVGAARAAAAAERASVKHAIAFNYRRLPALSLMKQMVDAGRIGQVRLWRGIWLSDEFLDPAIPFDWRFRRSVGASTTADLGAHLIDLARWMVGEVEAVAARAATFVGTRASDSGAVDVDVEDAAAALVQFAGGAQGTFEIAKVAAGRPCDFNVELNGSRGTLRFDYSRLNELWYADAEDPPELYGMRRIRAEHPVHPETEGWWPIGQGIGYGASFVNQAADLLAEWPDGTWAPDLRDAVRVQAVSTAIERAAAERRWIAVAEIANEGT